MRHLMLQGLGLTAGDSIGSYCVSLCIGTEGAEVSLSKKESAGKHKIISHSPTTTQLHP